MAKGYVYILSNEYMPGIVKIGKTTRTVEQRAFELYQTGVPTPFEIVAQFLTPDCHELEEIAHEHLGKSRLSGSREFFKISSEDAVSHIRRLHVEQISEFVDEFLPGYTPAISEMMMDESIIYMASDDLGAHPFEIVLGLNYIKPSEVELLYNRHKEKTQGQPEAAEKSRAIQ